MHRLRPGLPQSRGAGPVLPTLGDAIELAVGAGRPRDLRVQLDRMAIVLLCLAKLGVRTLALGDVTVEDRQTIRSRIGPDLGPGLPPVRPRVPVLERGRHALGHGSLVELTQRRVLGVRPDLPMGASDDLGLGPRIQPQPGRVDPQNAELPVEQDEGLVHAVEHASGALLALPQRTLAEDLAGCLRRGAEHAGNRAGVVPDGIVGEAEPGILAVTVPLHWDQQILMPTRLPGEGLVDQRPDLLPDVGPDHGEGAPERVGDAWRRRSGCSRRCRGRRGPAPTR